MMTGAKAETVHLVLPVSGLGWMAEGQYCCAGFDQWGYEHGPVGADGFGVSDFPAVLGARRIDAVQHGQGGRLLKLRNAIGHLTCGPGLVAVRPVELFVDDIVIDTDALEPVQHSAGVRLFEVEVDDVPACIQHGLDVPQRERGFAASGEPYAGRPWPAHSSSTLAAEAPESRAGPGRPRAIAQQPLTPEKRPNTLRGVAPPIPPKGLTQHRSIN